MKRIECNRRIVLAVTVPVSLKLMAGYPEYLARQGWDVHVVSSPVRDQTFPEGVTFHAIPMRREPSPLRDLMALIGWVRLLWRLRPTVVVAGTPKAGLLGMMAAWSVRVRVRVYMLRGLRLETESGPKRSLLHAMERISARCATRVQSVSHSLRDEFVSLGLAPISKVVVLGPGSSNGVSVPPGRWSGQTTRADLGLDDSSHVVGFVGRMTKDKGLQDLLAAIQIMREAGSSVQGLLVGPEDTDGSVTDFLRDCSLDEGSISWVGAVPEALPYFPAMDVLCLPTRREGFPNVVLEAAVSGVPAVVSDVTGARDSVIPGRTGVLVPPDNPDALAAALTSLISDTEGLELMGRSAREYVTQNFAREEIWELNREFLETEISTNSQPCAPCKREAT